METQRQRKIGKLLQKDLSAIFQTLLRADDRKGIVVSITQVQVAVDLSQAKVYVSVFPIVQTQAFMEMLAAHYPFIKHTLAQQTRHQLRKMPELVFTVDDSLEYLDGIEKALKGKDNPLTNPNLLNKRKLV